MKKMAFSIGFSMLSGLLFGAGLTISMMVDPIKVIGFLDIFGAWDPTLAFVMAGGLLVYFPFYYFLIKPNHMTVFKTPCQFPEKKSIDKKLIVGALIFGIGWGISGICPGPALVNLSGGLSEIIAFVISMLLGMIFSSKILSAKKQ